VIYQVGDYLRHVEYSGALVQIIAVLPNGKFRIARHDNDGKGWGIYKTEFDSRKVARRTTISEKTLANEYVGVIPESIKWCD
jgi:hypothetical protein